MTLEPSTHAAARGYRMAQQFLVATTDDGSEVWATLPLPPIEPPVLVVETVGEARS